MAMFGIGLLVHAQRLTGSFGSAGLVTGAYALCSALSAPQLGRLVDRHGQTTVLVAGATLTALVLVIIGILPRSAPQALLVTLGGATGLATPPLAACVRTLAPAIVAEPDRLPTLFAFESTVLELTFILGPPLALGLGAVWSTGAALLMSGLITLVFAAQPMSRRWRPDTMTTRPRGGVLRTPAMRTLVMILFGTGSVFGATEVGVTSATHALGSMATTGPLLGIWGLGSLLGGIVTTRVGGGSRSARGLTLLLAALALAHGALILATGSVLAIGAVILLAGATIAPTVSSIYAMVDGAAPAGTHTEAFSWLLTASLTGSAMGASAGGAIAQSEGAQAVFALVGVAGGLVALVAVLRSRTLKDVGARTRLGVHVQTGRRATRPQSVPQPTGTAVDGRRELARPLDFADRPDLYWKRRRVRPSRAQQHGPRCSPFPTTHLEEQ
jgi:MFS family permease